jgi:hypothetical protein
VESLQVSGLINRGANNIATDCTVAIKPCAFPCENKTMTQMIRIKVSYLSYQINPGEIRFACIPDRLRVLPLK